MKRNFTCIALLIIHLFSSCDNALQQAVIEDLKLPVPTISPAGGSFTEGQPLTMTQPEKGAEIFYVIKKDGRVVEEGVYSGPVNIGQHHKKFEVEAYTRKEFALDSDSQVETYNFEYGSVETPLISPAGDTFASDQWITISNTVTSTGCDIYYDIPQHPDFQVDSSPRLYTGPILLTGDDKTYTVNAYAATEGKPNSPAVHEEITISYDMTSPVEISPEPGLIAKGQAVSFHHPGGGTIYYQRVVTTAAGTVADNWRRYTGPVNIGTSTNSTVFNIKVEQQGFKTLQTSATYTTDTDSSPMPAFDIVSVDDAGGQLSAADINAYIVDVDASGGTVHRTFDISLSAAGLDSQGKIFYNIAKDADAVLPMVQINEEGIPEAVSAFGTEEYTGPIPIGTTDEGKTIRIKAISVTPGLNNSIPMDIEIDFNYLTAAEPVIQSNDSSSPRNSDWTWTAGLDPSANPAQRLGTNLKYTALGAGINMNESIALGEMATVVAPVNTNDILLLTVYNDSTDPQLNTSDSISSVFFDTVAPEAPEILPSSDLFNDLYINNDNTSPRISWKGESVASENYRVYVDAVAVNTAEYLYDEINGEHYLYLNSALGEGSHTFSVQQWDEAGNSSPIGDFPIIKDTIKPSITFHSPTHKDIMYSTTAAVYLTFSEAMLEEDVLDISHYSTSPSTGTVPVVARQNATKISVTPTTPFGQQAKVSVSVDQTLRDVAGNELTEGLDFYYFTVPVTRNNVNIGSVYQQFTQVPASTFPTGFDDSGSATVAVFDIAQTEVTYNLWKDIYDWAIGNGYTFMNSGTDNGSETPVSEISYADIIVWCNAASERMGLGFVYWNDGGGIINNANLVFSGGVNQNALMDGFRLPTVDEWECAARYIDGTEWLPGSHASGAYDMVAGKNEETYEVAWTANTPSGGGFLQPVKQLRGNPLLCYDMSGNIGEFVYDASDTNAAYKGSYYNSVANITHGVGNTPNFSTVTAQPNLGFRLARNTP